MSERQRAAAAALVAPAVRPGGRARPGPDGQRAGGRHLGVRARTRRLLARRVAGPAQPQRESRRTERLRAGGCRRRLRSRRRAAAALLGRQHRCRARSVRRLRPRPEIGPRPGPPCPLPRQTGCEHGAPAPVAGAQPGRDTRRRGDRHQPRHPRRHLAHGRGDAQGRHLHHALGLLGGADEVVAALGHRRRRPASGVRPDVLRSGAAVRLQGLAEKTPDRAQSLHRHHAGRRSERRADPAPERGQPAVLDPEPTRPGAASGAGAALRHVPGRQIRLALERTKRLGR